MSRKPRAVAALGVAALAVGLLAGCQSAAPADSSETPAAGGEPTIGGALTMTVPSDEGCADPQQVTGRALLTAARASVDSLVYQVPESTDFEPWLASEWEVSDDATTYTFTLRDDVTFSDGSPLTSATVKANFDAIQALGAKARVASAYLEGYAGTETPDEHTVVVTFEQPNATFLSALGTTSLGIISDASAAASQEDRCVNGIIGSGPYTLESYTQNQGQKFQVREDYDWAPESLHQGRGYVDSIEVQIVPESGVRAGSVVAGQSDIMLEVQAADISTLDAGEATIEVRSNPGIAQGFWVNPKRPVMEDLAVRQALQIGLDRETLVESTLTKYQDVATSALSATTPGWVDLSDKLGFDPDAANEILDEAGWKPGSDGIREKDGQRLSFELTYAAQRMGFIIPLMELAQQQYEELGMEMKLRPLPDADENTAWIENDYDLRISGLTRADADVLRTAFAGYNDELDVLLNKQVGQADPAERQKTVAEAQELIIDEGITLPINDLSLPLAHGPAVQNIQFTGDALLQLSEAWKQQ